MISFVKKKFYTQIEKYFNTKNTQIFTKNTEINSISLLLRLGRKQNILTQKTHKKKSTKILKHYFKSYLEIMLKKLFISFILIKMLNNEKIIQ